MKQPDHVLVYRLSALGDVAMTIPAVYSVARAWPSCTFHVVTTKFCSQLYIDAPANVVLHPVEGSVGTWGLLRQLNRIPVDAVADLHNVLRSWVVDMFYRLKGKRVCMLDKNRCERKTILNDGHVAARPFTHRYFDVFAQMGLPCEPSFQTLFDQQPSVPIEIEKGEERWVGIAPFARYQTKIYPVEKMCEVVRLLSEKSDTRVFLFGSRGQEADVLKQWEQLSPRVHSVAGRFTLQQELSLMSHLDVMVTMDSANMHLSSLVGTRVVSVWGSTTPSCGFMGWGQQESDAVCLHLPCQPCSISGCPSCKKGFVECMNQSPRTIVDRL